MLEREREIDDLRFQVAQLKGRMGAINADGEVDTGGIRDETARIDSELRHIVDDVVRSAEPVYRHFMAFPDLRDEVLGTGHKANAG
jgi:hypothetical protein